MSDHEDFARSFGAVAEAYERGRPTYPDDVVEWLLAVNHSTAPQPARGLAVVELGAGTGKLTEGLVAAGADVFATDPDDAMLDILSRKLPEVRATIGSAEQIPAPDASADVVVVGTAFHWFDPGTALPEIARVLKDGGQLAVCWNEYDTSIPWVRKLDRMVGHADQPEDRDTAGVLERSGLFSAVAETTFTHWQRVTRDVLLDMVSSHAIVAVLPPAERDAKLAEVAALYDDYGRGLDGMQLPYVTRCYRSTVIARPKQPVSLISTGPQPAVAEASDPDATVAVERSAFTTGGSGDGTTLLNLS